MKKQIVLVIDDEPANLRILGKILERRGLEVMAVRDGGAGLALAESSRPDLILLDINMPGLDGFEVCRRLKADPATRDTPVIFATILADLNNKIQGFQAGAVDYIPKPYEESEVLARVLRHLELYRLRRELADKNAELEAFAHTVSHSLKNPLARIESLTAILLENGLVAPQFAGQAGSILQAVQAAARQGRMTTEALLKLAEVSQGDFQHTLCPVNVRACAESAARNLQAHLDWQSGRWPKALGYAPWIEEIWCIYLDNALKYGALPIELGAQTVDGHAEYWVQDHGPGILEEEQALLFKPFVRLRTDSEGHGLGLSIVARIVHRLGGEAGVAEGGRRFYFRLKSAE